MGGAGEQRMTGPSYPRWVSQVAWVCHPGAWRGTDGICSSRSAAKEIRLEVKRQSSCVTEFEASLGFRRDPVSISCKAQLLTDTPYFHEAVGREGLLVTWGCSRGGYVNGSGRAPSCRPLIS